MPGGVKIADFFRRMTGSAFQRILVFAGRMLPRRGAVVMLHGVSDPDDAFSVTADRLRRLLDSVRGRAIPLEQWERRRRGFVAFTVDDVRESFYLHGYPLFVRSGVPFTLFVCVGLLGTPGYITEAQLHEMSSDPLCTVGSHGMDHTFYRLMRRDRRVEFLRGSRRRLEEICGREVTMFAFPYGSLYACGLRGKRCVRRFYRYGFGTVASPVTSPRLFGRSYLPRIDISLFDDQS